MSINFTQTGLVQMGHKIIYKDGSQTTVIDLYNHHELAAKISELLLELSADENEVARIERVQLGSKRTLSEGRFAAEYVYQDGNWKHPAPPPPPRPVNTVYIIMEMDEYPQIRYMYIGEETKAVAEEKIRELHGEERRISYYLEEYKIYEDGWAV